MEGLWALLESQPILTLFLVISVGYAAGEISIAGFRLGVGAIIVAQAVATWFLAG
jgi:putative transport protein